MERLDSTNRVGHVPESTAEIISATVQANPKLVSDFFSRSPWNKPGTGRPEDALIDSFSKPTLLNTGTEPQKELAEIFKATNEQRVSLLTFTMVFGKKDSVERLQRAAEESGDESKILDTIVATFCVKMLWASFSLKDVMSSEAMQGLHATFAQLSLPRTLMHDFASACIPYIEACNERFRDARCTYFSVPDIGDLVNSPRHASALRKTLSLVSRRIGDMFPPIITDTGHREALSRGVPLYKNLMERMENNFRDRFAETSGYTIEEFRSSLTRAPLAVRRIAERLRNGDFFLTVNTKPEHIEQVREEGVKNIFETGQGTYSREGSTPDYKHGRYFHEAEFYGLTESDFHNLPIEDRPKYFGITGGSERGLKKVQGNTRYGTALAVVRAKDVADRMTLTVGDSLNTAASASGAWDRMPIPLKYADVLAPLIFDRISRAHAFPLLHTGKIDAVIACDDGKGVSDSLLPRLPYPFQGRLKVSVAPYRDHAFGRQAGTLSTDYIEAQVLGPVPPDLIVFSRAGNKADDA